MITAHEIGEIQQAIQRHSEEMEMALQQFHHLPTRKARLEDVNSSSSSASSSCVSYSNYKHTQHSTTRPHFHTFGLHMQFKCAPIRRLHYRNGVVAEIEKLEDDAYTTEEDDDDDELDSAASILSLSDKPDRNTALLDDYEMEELDFVPELDPNHRSGTLSLSLSPPLPLTENNIVESDREQKNM